jgi:hypothetical protein
VARINDQVMTALEADVPGPELKTLLVAHRAAMADLTEAETQNAPDAETLSGRLAGAKKLKAQVAAVQKQLEQKSRDLIRQREKSHRTRQALDAYEKKSN